jgi:hypothetical protein
MCLTACLLKNEPATVPAGACGCKPAWGLHLGQALSADAGRALQVRLERLPLQQHIPQYVPGAARRIRLQPAAQPLPPAALPAAAARASRAADL